MANDGHVKIGVSLDKSGLTSGLSGLGNFAKSGFSVLANAAVGAVGLASTAVTALGGYAVKVGQDFEAGMSKVSAISGAAGEDLKALTEKAKEMGASTKFSATEASEAMQYMAMAGWKTEDMLSGIEGIMNLAAASGESLATTSDIVTDALTAFGLSAADSGHFADVLAAASSNANTNVSMMGETFKYCAPVAGALGFSVEDTAEAIGLMANSGIKASQAGTTLRSLMTSLAGEVKICGSQIGEVTIATTNADGSMRGLNEILTDCRGAFSQLSESEKSAAAEALVGKNAMSGLLALMNAAPEDIEKLNGAITECDGAAAEMAETMQDNLAGQITILKSAMEGLGLEIYESLQEPLKEAAKTGIEAVNELTEAFRSEGAAGLAKAGANLMSRLLLGISQKLPGLIQIAVQTVNSFLGAISENLPAFVEAGFSILENLGEGVLSIMPNMLSLGGEIVTRIAQGVIERLPALAERAREMIGSFQAAVTEHLPEVLAMGTQILSALLEGILSVLPSVFECVQETLGSFMEAVMEQLPEILELGANLLTEFINGIASMLPELVPMAIELVLMLAENILANLPKIVDAGIKLILALGEGVINALPTLIEKVPQIINSFFDNFDSLLWKIIEAGGNLIVSLGKGIIDNIPVIIANAGEIVMAIVNVILHLDMLSMGKDLIKNLGEGVKSMASAIGQAAKDLFQKLLHPFSDTGAFRDIGKNLIDGLIGGIKSMGSSLIQAAKDSLGGLVNGAKNFLGIKSPSRLMRDVIGKNAIAGVNVGLEEETPKLEKTSRMSAERMVEAMQGAARYRGNRMVEETVWKDLPVSSEGKEETAATRRYIVEVPVEIDGREVARATAEFNDEQMAWEEMYAF